MLLHSKLPYSLETKTIAIILLTPRVLWVRDPGRAQPGWAALVLWLGVSWLQSEDGLAGTVGRGAGWRGTCLFKCSQVLSMRPLSVSERGLPQR